MQGICPFGENIFPKFLLFTVYGIPYPHPCNNQGKILRGCSFCLVQHVTHVGETLKN